MLPSPFAPWPPKMLNGTQPGTAHARRFGPERQCQLARVENVMTLLGGIVLAPVEAHIPIHRPLAELQVAAQRARHHPGVDGLIEDARPGFQRTPADGDQIVLPSRSIPNGL